MIRPPDNVHGVGDRPFGQGSPARTDPGDTITVDLQNTFRNVGIAGPCLDTPDLMDTSGMTLTLPVGQDVDQPTCQITLSVPLSQNVTQQIQATFSITGTSAPTLTDGVHLLWAGFPGAIPIGRDGEVSPVNGDFYDEVVMRVRATERTLAYIAWQDCPGIPGECDQLVQQHLEEGWQTLRFRPDWSGPVYAIRFGTSSATSVDIDDVRIVNQATPVAVGLDGPVSLTATGTAQEGFDPAVYGIDPPVSDGPGGSCCLIRPSCRPAPTP